MEKHVQFVIKGRVENTGFRFYALRGANRFQIRGEVSQKTDSIVIDAEGDDAALAEFKQWCRKGSEGSIIENFCSTEKELSGYDEFRIL
jgi:acylphosphatase